MSTQTTKRMNLTAQNVKQVIQKCLYSPSDNTSDVTSTRCERSLLRIEGIENIYTFDPDMLAKEEQHILDMLSELPNEFKQGWSFWEMYKTRHNEQWASKPIVMEELLVLGIAINKISYVFPREIWWSLPGGAPYLLLS